MAYTGLTVVIPTRNRAELAANSVQSVLEEARPDVSILISDNSTVDEEVDRLATFCRELGNERVRYVRPSHPLAMVENWECALAHAMQSPTASHFLYLTDRSVFKRRQLTSLLRLASRLPDKVISYNCDMVNDCTQPIILEQVAWSGSVFELDSNEVLLASAQLKWRFYDCLPRMLNCIAPRDTLDAIVKKYGNVFLSIAPDLCFAYRFLERFDSFLYFDKALVVQYALSRSHGYSQGRGKVTDEYLDFLANLKDKSINNAAPIPGINTNMNTVIHEYCVTKEQSNSPKFPEINKGNYFDYLAREIRGFEDAQRKREMEALLDAHRHEFASAPRSGHGKTSAVPPKVIKFHGTAAAIKYALSHTRSRNWCASTEELHAKVKFVPQKEDSFILYVRLLFVRAWAPVKPILEPVVSPITDAASDFYERYIGWRFRQKIRH